MKQRLETQLNAAVKKLLEEFPISTDVEYLVELERVKDSNHGDYASNIAMVLAKPLKKSPRDIATAITNLFPDSDQLERIEIAGPGFINFYLKQNLYYQTLSDVLTEGKKYGCSVFGNKQKILLEFVSSNPTGPIHVGHARGAAYGATLSNIMEAVGFEVTREYYVNDVGRQMDILTLSVWLRYLQHLNACVVAFPTNAYQGDYLKGISTKLADLKGDIYSAHVSAFDSISETDPDQEKHIDELIAVSKLALGEDNYRFILDYALNQILDEIREDLSEFGVHYDNWFSERSLIEDGSIKKCIDSLQHNNEIYEKDGALWFRSTNYGDKKDRVVVRENGQITYFASDIAYHLNKFERGYDLIINIWGADHHGYISRVKGAVNALGADTDKLQILLVQFATLYREKEKLQMSTRSGEYVTLTQLRDEIGNDASRFFYITRQAKQHLDFDLELAKSQSNDNPVYYIQYAHARICSVLNQIQERGLELNIKSGLENTTLLVQDQELSLLKSLTNYPEVVLTAAKNYEPHTIAFFLRDLANEFHTYYNSFHFLIDDANLRHARICLILATKQVISNGLALLGVSAPEEM